MLSIEQSQKISDLRQRMLRNVQEGKPAQEGLTEDDLRQALEWIRSNRASVGAKGGNTKAAKSEKPSKDPSQAVLSLEAKLAKLGVNLD
jgi:hypothetical protein